MYKTIVIAYDGSVEGRTALTESKELAAWGSSQLWLVAVKPNFTGAGYVEGGLYDPSWDSDEEKRFQAILDDGLHSLVEAGFDAKGRLLKGDPVLEISRFAREISADLIVVGHRHLNSRVARWWSGSISGSLVEEAPCSVFCVVRYI